MAFSIYGKSHEVLWTQVGLLTFAIIFFVIGTSRLVEFQGLKFTKLTKYILMATHVAGTLAFSICLVSLGMQIDESAKDLSAVLFAFSVFSLFPIHIYLAIKRKISIDERSRKL